MCRAWCGFGCVLVWLRGLIFRVGSGVGGVSGGVSVPILSDTNRHAHSVSGLCPSRVLGIVSVGVGWCRFLLLWCRCGVLLEHRHSRYADSAACKWGSGGTIELCQQRHQRHHACRSCQRLRLARWVLPIAAWVIHSQTWLHVWHADCGGRARTPPGSQVPWAPNHRCVLCPCSEPVHAGPGIPAGLWFFPGPARYRAQPCVH